MTVDAMLKRALEAHRAGNFLGAKKGYFAVLDKEPNQPDTLALLGVLLGSMGQINEALIYIKRAVDQDPKAALFRIHLGNALALSGDQKGAVSAFEEALRLEPGRPEIMYNLANAYREAEQWSQAEGLYKHVLEVVPAYVQARNNLALVYEHYKKMDEAIAELERAVADAPDYCEGWLNLCSVAEKNEEYEKSLRAGEQAKVLQPQNPSAWFGIGVAYCRMEKHKEALPFYTEALRLKPEWPEVWDNLGQSYQQVCVLDKAEDAFKKCIYYAGQNIEGEGTRQIDENEYGNRYWHLALLELLKGDYLKGFAHYRSRFKELEGLERQKWPRPVWQGEDIEGQTILVMEEQGAGDCLMMMRYISLLKSEKKAAKVFLYVSKHLAPLFEGGSEIDELIITGGTIPDFDCYATIFDLPYAFQTTVTTVPDQVPYLPTLQPDTLTSLDETDKPKVAVVWAGAPLHKHDHRRSLPLSLFKDIFDNERVQFYSLNLDKREGDDELLAQTNVIDLAPKIKNFADTARFMAQMDLIISCDTSTAHMAGGLGRKAWTLIPFSPDWRWLLGREDSPWYPSMKVFRQKEAGDWAGVVAQVQDELKETFK